MQETIDYIYVPKMQLNEGLSSGTVTSGIAVFTKDYLFVIPFSSETILGSTHTSKNASDTAALKQAIEKKLAEMSLEDFTQEMLESLPPERVYLIPDLQTFKVQVGFWIIGGLTLKKRDGARQAMNVQPQKRRKAIADFFNM